MKLKTISRRSFLKGAGVAALAVAAAGVMTGCSTDSNGNPTKDVEISYIFADENIKVGTQKLAVGLKDVSVPVEKLQIPADYKLENENAKEFPIDKNNKVVVKVTGTKTPVMDVVINFICNGSNLYEDGFPVRLPSNATVVSVQTQKDTLEGMYPGKYKLKKEEDAVIATMGNYKFVNVEVVEL